jgi:hypothetical protein
MSEKQVFKVRLEKAEDSEACGIYVPFDVQKVFGTKARVPVRGTINGFPYRSSIAPMGGRHIMAVNKGMREGAKIKAGDLIAVVMDRDTEERTITPPGDLEAALKNDPAAQAAWERCSYTHKKEFVLAIEDAKKPETRSRRIQKTLAELRGKK